MAIDEELLEDLDRLHEYVSHLYFFENWNINMLALRFNLTDYKIRQMLQFL